MPKKKRGIISRTLKPRTRKEKAEDRAMQREKNSKKRAAKAKKPTRQARDDTAGSYLTTRGKKKRQLDRALDYTLE